MNPLLIFKTVRDLSALIEEANRLAGPDKRWSLAFTNRSFIAQVIATLAVIAIAVGMPLPVPVDVASETVFAFITVGALAWAGIERLLGKTRAIWNRRQAVEAVTEADALTKALDAAGAR